MTLCMYKSVSFFLDMNIFTQLNATSAYLPERCEYIHNAVQNIKNF